MSTATAPTAYRLTATRNVERCDPPHHPCVTLSPSTVHLYVSQTVFRREKMEEKMNAQRESDLAEVVTRLREQKKENTAAWANIGRREGRIWAEGAPYADLVEWAKMAARLGKEIGVLWATVELPEDVEEHLSDPDGAAAGAAFDRGAYVEAWCEAVGEFWAEVEGEL